MADKDGGAQFDVLVFGLIGVEYAIDSDGAPQPGAARRIRAEERCLGGSAALCAAALARWGARVALLGNPLGNDANGRFASAQLAGIPNLELIATTGADFETPYTVTIHAPDALPTVLVSHRAVESDIAEPHTQTPPQWPWARLVCCDSEFGRPAADLAQWCADQGIPLVFKGLPGGPPLASPPSGVIVTLPAGLDFPRLPGRLRQLAHQWQTLVVALERHRCRGAWAQQGGRTGTFSIPCSAPKAGGGVGMEEVFRAGLLWGRLQEWNWERSLRFALAAATQKLEAAPGLEGIPQLEAVNSLGAEPPLPPE